jgi:mycoredoxin
VTTFAEPTADRPTIFTTTWCGYCRRLKSQLDRAGVGYAEVDIEDVADGAEIVAKANGGNLTVPTVLFADGSTLTNPSAGQVREKLAVAS